MCWNFGTSAVGIVISAYVVGTIIANVIYTRRKSQERKLREQAPLEVQIADMATSIRRHTAYIMGVLREWGEDGDWIIPWLEFYVRLEAIASSPSPCAEECERLAAEWAEFIREKQLKGFDAHRFAAHRFAAAFGSLLRKRDGA